MYNKNRGCLTTQPLKISSLHYSRTQICTELQVIQLTDTGAPHPAPIVTAPQPADPAPQLSVTKLIVQIVVAPPFKLVMSSFDIVSFLRPNLPFKFTFFMC
jgi:hypothetical protein